MKELTIEEKAKYYDEAVEKLREIIIMDNKPVTPKEIAEYLFPELNDDERIKKWIKKELESKYVVDNIVNNVMADKAFAWLEKQGEHANFRKNIQVGDKVTRNKDGVLVNLSQLNRVAKKGENQCQIVTKKDVDDAYLKGICDAKHELEKQSKYKPAWSEEDKNFMYDTLSNLTELKDRYGEGYGNVGKCIDWLNSLKDRYAWEPSDEQMAALSDINVTGAISYAGQGQELINLYKDLKKLKEE